MPFAPIYGGSLYYETHGSGPPLIFTHGIGGNHLSWWQQIPAFRDRYTCLTYDAPGFGRSDHPEGDWTYADTLAALIDHLGLERPTLVAQSMGGWAALAYALTHPQRVPALVMAGSPGPIQLSGLEQWLAGGNAQRDDLSRRGIHPACGERMASEQPAKHFLYQEIAALNPTPWSPARQPGGFARVPPIQPQQLQCFTVPTQFVIGAEDAVIPAQLLERAAAAVPGARVQSVSQAGHSVYFERPDQFNALVGDFLVDAAG